jgi:hypothetical protein
MPTSLVSTGVQFPDDTIQTTAGAGGNYIQRVYTSPATWTKPANLKAVKVTVIGGGGGGGGARGTETPNPEPPSSPAPRSGGHGGGGGFALEYLDAPAIPGPVSVTVGSGGTAGPAPGTVGGYSSGGTGGSSSFGPFLSATGGAGSGSGTPGAGGAGSGGQVNIPGGRSNSSSVGRDSGNNTTPLGPANQSAPGFGAGVVGNVYGNGATGALAPGVPGFTPYAGGVGGAGIVIVEEFY